MNSPHLQSRAETLKNTQILAGALTLGVVVMVLAAIALVEFGEVGGGGFNGLLVALSSAVMAVAMIAIALVPLLVRVPEAADEKQLLNIFAVRDLFQKGILEGLVLLNTVVYILEGNIWSLVFAGAFTAAMLMSFPTKTKLDNFVSEHLKNQFNN